MRRVKRVIRNTIGEHFGANLADVVSQIGNADVVSFDIFDTLVQRDIPNPEYIHTLVGLRFAKNTEKEIKEYSLRRIQAEYDARKLASRDEVTLKEIFERMKCISEQDKRLLIHLEQEQEYEVCCKNQAMKNVYDIARSMKKHIVITSDMYLPEELIHKILGKCGYEGYERIYLSSSYGVTKSSGRLFKYLKEDYADMSGEILHIGDNVKSDYWRARQSGLKAILIKKRRANVLFYKKSEMKTWEEKCFYEFLMNHKLPNEDRNEIGKDKSVFARTIGYEILGPMLWGYTCWLQEQLKADKIKKVFFLSREGALLQRAYEIIFPNSKVIQKYLYVSRQALQIPMLSECYSYHEMIQIVKPVLHSHTLDNIGKECMLDNRYWEECSKLNLDKKSSVFNIPTEKQKLYFDLLYRFGKQRFREQKELVQAYLKQEGFEGKVAVADIGWQGTMQKALSVYCNDGEITGYYLGARNVRSKEFYKGLVRKGYLFEPEIHESWNLKIRFTTAIAETLFSNCSGSVSSYFKDQEQIKPCLRENEHGDCGGMLLKQIQDAALQFLKDWKDSGLVRYKLTNELIMKGYEHFAVSPMLKTVNFFKEFYVLDGGIEKMLPENFLFYYICHPKALKDDINESGCKIFALKNIFKLPFPYYHLMRFLLHGLKINSPYAKNMEQ